MTMTESSAKETISDSTKDSSKSKDRKDKSRPLTKVIIRRLPPTMSEETFVEQISPIPDHDYFYFVDADRTLGIHAFCRAYINFVNTDDIFIFKEKFDNYIFVDNRGNEFTAVVEYAPYQGVPKRKSRKNDPKCGTIESDQQYIDFLESLKIDENDTNKQENKTEFSYQIKDDKKITTTPLLEFLAARKVEKQRAKAERKEERRKRDLERKRMRDEERRKKKLEVNKAKPSAITEENSDEASLLKEDDPDKTKSSKFQEGAGARVGLPNEKEETPKFGSNKTSKESMKPKGKSFRERRAEESFKKSDDKKVDTKYKYRDDKRNYDTDSKFKKPDYKTNYVRDKKREDDRKFGFKNESKDSKRYESREFRNDNLKTDKKTEIKKYSEARKEREARRIESKRLATKNTTSTESNVKSALPTDNPNDMSEMNKDSAQVETNVENNIDDVENLAENFEEKANIAEDCSSKVEDRVDEDMCNNTEAIEKQESLDSACENVKDTSNMNNTEMTHNVSGDINENKFETEPKRFNCEKRNYDDRRDPRTERRIRNKDRPSMAIYQPGKARLNQKEKSTINPDEPTTEQKSKSVN